MTRLRYIVSILELKILNRIYPFLSNGFKCIFIQPPIEFKPFIEYNSQTGGNSVECTRHFYRLFVECTR